jgi:hypothetical protein
MFRGVYPEHSEGLNMTDIGRVRHALAGRKDERSVDSYSEVDG